MHALGKANVKIKDRFLAPASGQRDISAILSYQIVEYC